VLHIHTVPLRNTSGEKMASVQHPSLSLLLLLQQRNCFIASAVFFL